MHQSQNVKYSEWPFIEIDVLFVLLHRCNLCIPTLNEFTTLWIIETTVCVGTIRTLCLRTYQFLLYDSIWWRIVAQVIQLARLVHVLTETIKLSALNFIFVWNYVLLPPVNDEYLHGCMVVDAYSNLPRSEQSACLPIIQNKKFPQ